MKDFDNLPAFLDYFSSEDACRAYLVQQRWGGTPTCPYCGCQRSYVAEGGKRYKCAAKHCRLKYSVTSGSIFADTKLPLRTWFTAIYLGTYHSKGISSVQLGKDLGITQKSAWHILHRIREVVADHEPKKMKGTVQMDSTYIGGKEANKHLDKRTVPSSPKGCKTEVLGMLEKGGHVWARSVVNSSSKYVQPIIRKYIEIGSAIHTDEAHSFKQALKGEDYTHEKVHHGVREFQRGHVGTNGIENYWSHFKRTIIGVHHFISPKHLDAYCNGSTWIYNNRDAGIQERFNRALVRVNAKQLTFKKLIAPKAAGHPS